MVPWGKRPVLLHEAFLMLRRAQCERTSFAGQGDRDPYWSRPWPSATALARHILARPRLCMGRAVCEIGAGLGIASIAAVMAGQCWLRFFQAWITAKLCSS